MFIEKIKNLNKNPNSNPILLENDVHVWSVKLDVPEIEIQKLNRILSMKEQLRAEKFFFEQDRRHYIVSHGFQRIIIGRYLNLEPSEVEFSYGFWGKPALASAINDWPLCFNMSHSKQLALYAISYNRPVGIDIEHIRPFSDADQIAKNYFSPQEYDVITSLPPYMKYEAFFNIWTYKEAYVKATGEGLGGLEQIETAINNRKSLKRTNPLKLISTTTPYSTYHFIPQTGYIAAVVVKGYGCNLSFFQVSNSAFETWKNPNLIFHNKKYETALQE